MDKVSLGCPGQIPGKTKVRNPAVQEKTFLLAKNGTFLISLGNKPNGLKYFTLIYSHKYTTMFNILKLTGHNSKLLESLVTVYKQLPFLTFTLAHQ